MNAAEAQDLLQEEGWGPQGPPMTPQEVLNLLAQLAQRLMLQGVSQVSVATWDTVVTCAFALLTRAEASREMMQGAGEALRVMDAFEAFAQESEAVAATLAHLAPALLEEALA